MQAENYTYTEAAPSLMVFYKGRSYAPAPVSDTVNWIIVLQNKEQCFNPKGMFLKWRSPTPAPVPQSVTWIIVFHNKEQQSSNPKGMPFHY